MLSLPCTAYDRILLCLFLIFLTLFWAFLSFQIHPSEDYAVKQIAKAIDNDSVVERLKTDSVTFTVDTDGDGEEEEFWYNWTYTGNISVVKVENAQTGAVSYVVVYTMNRTAEKDSK